ncbi:ATP-dependent helicase [Mesorhizobium sp. B3-1-9]|uniref:ATP-dependent helicase n=1 Tax=Mesorhizobium sp. B3-1-9 TaxID=2589892 RepID=UPI00112D91A7|nr:ATP-dependent helicase [Mesorhizobium sp. B3-1-9]TPI29248.1 ATP-dependent helicase [Mesorhizobium sp. B3-1-9]
MTDAFDAALAQLTDIQRQAVEWRNGAVLVLAGPGSGKTQVLTCRIAKLLRDAPEKNFRVLALTFTNAAADAMKARVATFAPGLEERADIGTFHSFCGKVLRQHGVHLQISPDFIIYSRDQDREALLYDALGEAAARGESFSRDDARFLPLIDRLKSRLIGPSEAESALRDSPSAEAVAKVYELYESELRRLNALDFNSLIFETYRLATKFPTIAARYSRSHPYWLLDEFQDTNSAQFKLVSILAGDTFRNIFAVADDDQIIYQWNGASFRHIQGFRNDFSAELIQLPTNYRCPPVIVKVANKLVSYNTTRTPAKLPLVPGKADVRPESQQLHVRRFDTETDEADGIADEIAELGQANWHSAVVLGRSRGLLDRMLRALGNRGVPAYVAQRRDDFLSPELRWLVAVLSQLAHPLDRRNFGVLVEAFNRMTDTSTAVAQLLADAETSGRSYLDTWLLNVGADQPLGQLLSALRDTIGGSKSVRQFIDQATAIFEETSKAFDRATDLAEDVKAWKSLSSDIGRHIGRNAPLDQFLQELQLRSKEPAPKSGSVTLMTIHSAKGREFDNVFVVGLAEDVMPSYLSRQKGDTSPEMEEERRSCFVAITRTKESLVLSWADYYNGWAKAPSRFLVEMELIS